MTQSNLFAKAKGVNKIDIIFVGLLVGLIAYYSMLLSQMHVPIWDGAVYLENAENWLSGAPLYEIYRPPMLSWIISVIWSLAGENWEIAKFIPAAFTIGAGTLLYLTLRGHKGRLFALGVTSLTMLNAQVLFWSTQLHAESVSMFFLILTLYFLKSRKPLNFFLSGVSAGLTFASRYPILLQAMTIIVVEAFVQRNSRLFGRVMVGAVPVICIIITIMFLKTGSFQTSLDKDDNLSFLPSAFYIFRSFDIWGYVIVLVPLALLFRRTYSDKYNYTFILWFVVSLLFWSANASNHQERFTFQFMPAVSYLAILAIENIIKSDLIFHRRQDRTKRILSQLRTSSIDNSSPKEDVASSDEAKMIPIPDMPGFYRKEGELETIIYQMDSEDRMTSSE